MPDNSKYQWTPPPSPQTSVPQYQNDIPPITSATPAELEEARRIGMDMERYYPPSALERRGYRPITNDDRMYFYVQRELGPDLLLGGLLCLAALILTWLHYQRYTDLRRAAGIYVLLAGVTYAATYLGFVFADANPDDALRAVVVFNIGLGIVAAGAFALRVLMPKKYP